MSVVDIPIKSVPMNEDVLWLVTWGSRVVALGLLLRFCLMLPGIEVKDVIVAAVAEAHAAGADAEAQQQEDRISSGAAAESLSDAQESTQKHCRIGSTSFLIPPELATLTAFLKVQSFSPPMAILQRSGRILPRLLHASDDIRTKTALGFYQAIALLSCLRDRSRIWVKP